MDGANNRELFVLTIEYSNSKPHAISRHTSTTYGDGVCVRSNASCNRNTELAVHKQTHLYVQSLVNYEVPIKIARRLGSQWCTGCYRSRKTTWFSCNEYTYRKLNTKHTLAQIDTLRE